MLRKNRLQLARERLERSRSIIDLAATNFHAAGLRFPTTPLTYAARTYLFSRNYRPDPRGAAAAREAVSAYYSRAGIDIPADRIIITASSSESYSLLFSTLAEVGDNVLLPKPSYPLFEEIARYSRVQPRFYRLDPRRRFSPDLHSVRRLIDDRTRFLVVISPGNPTGQLVGAEEMASLAQLCGQKQIGLIHDEVFSEQIYAPVETGSKDQHRDRSTGKGISPPVAPNTLPRAAAIRSGATSYTLNGVSKMFAAPELKLGWIAIRGAPGAVEGAYRELELANDTFLSCSGLSQALLPSMFAIGAPFQRRMRACLQRNRDMLCACVEPIAGVSLLPPHGGIHGIMRLDPIALKRDMDDENMAVDLLEREGVYLHPGYFYGIDDGCAFVLSILKHPTELEAGLTRLARFLSV